MAPQTTDAEHFDLPCPDHVYMQLYIHVVCIQVHVHCIHAYKCIHCPYFCIIAIDVYIYVYIHVYNVRMSLYYTYTIDYNTAKVLSDS